MSIFTFQSSEEIFNHLMVLHENDRGYRTRLAAAVRVHPSYITRISQGAVGITPDQATAMAEFWGFSIHEKEFFLWLVLKSRSTDPNMTGLANEKIAQIRKANDELAASLTAEEVNPLDENEYYMNWIFAAIHMFATLQVKPTVGDLSERLGLPKRIVDATARTLVKMNLVEIQKDGRLKATETNIHLSNRSWMASIQHRNWRIMSADRISRPGNTDLRYSGAHSISVKDLARLKEMIREFAVIRRFHRPSPCKRLRSAWPFTRVYRPGSRFLHEMFLAVRPSRNQRKRN